MRYILVSHRIHKTPAFPWVADFFIVWSRFANPRGFLPIHEVPRRNNHHSTMRSLHLVVVTLHNNAWFSKYRGFITGQKFPTLGLKFFNSLRQQYSFAEVYVLSTLSRIVTALSLDFLTKVYVYHKQMVS
jgi:hypothetical protein